MRWLVDRSELRQGVERDMDMCNKRTQAGSIFPVAFFLLLCLGATLLAVSAEAAVNYSVRGQLKVNAIDEIEANRGAFVYKSTAWTYSFTVSVSEDAWHIEAIPTLQPTLDDDLGLPPGYTQTALGWRLVAASNGSEFSKVKNGPRSTPEAVYQVQRGAGSAPFGVEREIAALWYAYASHRELAHGGQGWIVPMENLPIDVFAATTNRVKGHVILFEDLPGLPKHVTTFGYAHDIAGGQIGYLDADFKFTNSVFRVTAETNVGGLTFPLEARVNCYAVGTIRGDVRIKPSYEIVIETQSITPSATLPQYPPELSGGFIVSDYRYMNKHGNGIANVMTKDAWPTDDRIRSESMEQISRTSQEQQHGYTKFIIYALLAFPAVFVIANLKLKQNRKEKQ